MIDLPYTLNNLELHFSAMDFTEPWRNQFSYYLKGIETQWIHKGFEHSAQYLNLAPGKYGLSLPQTGLVLYYNFDYGVADGSNSAINMIGNLARPGAFDGHVTNFALNGNSANLVTVTPTGYATPSAPIHITGEQPVETTMATNSFSIYPNPTSGNFTLVQKGNTVYENVEVKIFTMKGNRLLAERMTGERSHEFSLADFPLGLYFVRIVAENYAETIKLVKTG